MMQSAGYRQAKGPERTVSSNTVLPKPRTEPMVPRASGWIGLRPGLWAVVVAVGLAMLAYQVAGRIGLAQARAALDQSLLLTSRAVDAEIDRFRALPDVAAEDPRINAALRDPAGIDAANRYLQAVADHAGASDLFLIDGSGITIAASNWQNPDGFVGQNYAFRPYFQQAMATGRGQFYAIGVTTGVPGYFLARRVGTTGAFGVLVVKVDLRPIQDTWQAAGLQTALADGDGVVFLAGRADWVYRPTRALSPQLLERITDRRTYDGIDLAASPALFTEPAVGRDARGDGWLARTTRMTARGWQLIAAQPSAPIRAMAVASALVAALVALFAAGIARAWDQQRQIIALRLSQSDRLEEMVRARTVDLAREVEARTQAETDLRAAHEQLIHTEKMAALGRMSTAIVHEISQPLAAMEATLVAAELAGGQNERLTTARGLIRRMQRTTKHLKSFGRKEAGTLNLVDLGPVAMAAQELVMPRARVVGVIPQFTPPTGPVQVIAGAVRMEQVVVNLLLNALDAVEGAAEGQITLTLAAQDNVVRLQVTDNGVGIAPDALPRVSEPFFSTKSKDGGMGLGLSICQAILGEFGGTLDVHSVQGQGTTVTVTLAAATVPAAVPGLAARAVKTAAAAS